MKGYFCKQPHNAQVHVYLTYHPHHATTQPHTYSDLIRSGQNPAAKDEDSWTPLHYAAWFGRDHVARVLMEDWQGAPMARTDRNATGGNGNGLCAFVCGCVGVWVCRNILS